MNIWLTVICLYKKVDNWTRNFHNGTNPSFSQLRQQLKFLYVMLFWYWRRSTKALRIFKISSQYCNSELNKVALIDAMAPFAIVTRWAKIWQWTIRLKWVSTYNITDSFSVVISTPDMPKTQILSTCCVGLSSYIFLLPRGELNDYWFTWVFLLNLCWFSPWISFKFQVNYTDIWLTAYRILLGYTEQSKKRRWGLN